MSSLLEFAARANVNVQPIWVRFANKTNRGGSFHSHDGEFHALFELIQFILEPVRNVPMEQINRSAVVLLSERSYNRHRRRNSIPVNDENKVFVSEAIHAEKPMDRTRQNLGPNARDFVSGRYRDTDTVLFDRANVIKRF